MAWLILPNKFTRQPQFTVGLDRNNPITVGLQATFSPVMGRMVDTHQGNSVASTSDTGTQQIGVAGISRAYSATTGSIFANRPRYQLASAMTIVIIVDVNTLTNYGTLISCFAGGEGWELDIGSQVSISNIFVQRVNATGAVQYSSGANRLTAGSKNNFIAVTYPSSAIESVPTIYVNGVAYSGSLLSSIGTGAQVASTATLKMGAGPGTQLDGAVLFAALWSRALSADDIESVRRNHAQVYQAPSRRIWARVGFKAAFARGSNYVINAGNAL